MLRFLVGVRHRHFIRRVVVLVGASRRVLASWAILGGRHIRPQAVIARVLVVAIGFLVSSQAEATPLFTPIAQSNTVSMTQTYPLGYPCPCPPGGLQTVVPFNASVASTQLGNFDQSFQNTFTVPPVNGPSYSSGSASSQSFSMDDSSISVLFSTSLLPGSGTLNTAFPEVVNALSSFDIQFSVTQATQLDVSLSFPTVADFYPAALSVSLPGIGEVLSNGFGLTPPLNHQLGSGQVVNLHVTLDPGTYDFSGGSVVQFSPGNPGGDNNEGGTGNVTLLFSPVPEPGTALLMLTGLMGLALRRHRARAASLG